VIGEISDGGGVFPISSSSTMGGGTTPSTPPWAMALPAPRRMKHSASTAIESPDRPQELAGWCRARVTPRPERLPGLAFAEREADDTKAGA
jgi:hypothetical protein